MKGQELLDCLELKLCSLSHTQLRLLYVECLSHLSLVTKQYG